MNPFVTLIDLKGITSSRKMRFGVILLVGSLTVAGILLFSSFQEVKGSPKGRGGGGGRGGGSRGSSSRGGSRGSRFGGGWGKSSGGYKSTKTGSTKSFAAKHWKKAAAFGAGTYVSYKLGKAVSKLYIPHVPRKLNLNLTFAI